MLDLALGRSDTPALKEMHMELFKELIELSQREKRGLTFHLRSQAVAGIVTKIIGNEAVEVRSQSFSRMIIRLEAVDAVCLA
jgi:hypothetical protein